VSIQNVLSDSKTLALPYPASTAVARGDLLYWDSVNKLVKPLTSKATLASEILDQAAVAAAFVGASWDVRLVSEITSFTASDFRVVQIEGVFDTDCPSQIFYPGDLVGATWNGGTALANQVVTKVNNLALAIGVVVNGYGTAYGNNGVAVTRVRCRLLSRWCWDLCTSRPSMGDSQGIGATVLADSNITLTLASNPILSQAPSTARNITLPDEARSAGFTFYFTNNAGGATSVTFLGSAGGAIKGNSVVPQNKTAILWSDGTSWNGLVSA
jgi:hypothetical protein